MKQMYPKNGRVILHVDMNSFYASVEMAYDPTLKGKPLAIAGNPEERRGIIVTCSYEARSFGVKTTMPLWEAKKLCPQLIIMKPNFERYRAASMGMFDILHEYSTLVEPVSIDEGYVDITDSYEFGSPIEIAETIQKQIFQQLDLPCSIGVAPNKFLAKMASDMKKPMGITVLRKRDVPHILWPMQVEEMHGVGKKTGEKLRNLNIATIGELAKADEIVLKAALGINGPRLKQKANGQDLRKVDPESASEFKSVGNSTTLPRDVSNQRELLQVFEKLSSQVSSRLKRKKVMAVSLGITIRYKDRKTITRSRKLKNPIQQDEEIYRMAKELFIKHWNGNAVRLLGITGTDLVEPDQAVKQLDLFSFEKDAKKEPLFQTMDLLRKKYGAKIIDNAGALSEMKLPRPKIGTDTSFNKDFLQSRPGKGNKKDDIS
ncbi:DNA polymerase IV [Cytobacillus oceanisediminis]|uniref:DNA polymerase IV n=1 Tax=Cytobacillus TaxID=2675230 RepID=UPI002041536A|nr:DNA polymerase IV [Cytobacillus oceanisediminis]MCM3243708.1 DNA polymerase IV [Cytobacillus oceanisediminis]MCM3404985.1 DNA polymerase IV [Cytobacillus oceanisediminis]MDK7664472.1 DNA polymerase IV [Cytobacillus oceanisediminis]